MCESFFQFLIACYNLWNGGTKLPRYAVGFSDLFYFRFSEDPRDLSIGY